MTDTHSAGKKPKLDENQRGGFGGDNERGHASPMHVAKDPVCGMDVAPLNAKYKAEHGGQTYYFCAAGCRTKFIAEPLKFLEHGSASNEPVAVPEGTIYTCPMHPEIRQVGPGSCPICGMALEPETVSAETGPNPELADMTRRF
jgi:P-type Cu+ transporter